ncbi:MAG: cytochrome c [Deltaproteobacteria bacterium]|nr:cytochrome c [Deltaproteobacteria bacterium]
MSRRMRSLVVLVSTLVVATGACRKQDGEQAGSQSTASAPALAAGAVGAEPRPADPPATTAAASGQHVVTGAGDPRPADPPTGNAGPADPPPAPVEPSADGAGLSQTASDPPPSVPSIDAASLLNARCSVCHGAERATGAASRDREWWTRTIKRMVRNGARLSESEQQALIDYMVNRPTP